MGQPSISVVIPCHNGSEFLNACVSSVVAQNVGAEIIIVDDGSTDNSIQLAGGLIRVTQGHILLICQNNSGPAVARNAGLRAASGTYLCFLDVDDELAPGALDAAIKALEADPSATAAQGRIEIVDLHRPVQEWHRQSMEATLPGNIIMRTEAARQLGGFPVDRAFRGKVGGEDGCFRLQLARYGKVVQLERLFLRYRIRRGSHADFFLDRSTLRDGKIVFTEPSPEEKDGTLFAAFNRYVDQVADRKLSRATALLQEEITAAWEYERSRHQLEQLSGNIDSLEGFAVYAFSKRWALGGPVVAIGGPQCRAVGWLAAGCKAAGGNIVAIASTTSQGELQELDAIPELRRTLTVRDGDPEEIARSWQDPIRILFIDHGETNRIARDAVFWSQHVAQHGLLIILGNVQDPTMTALFQQFRRDTVRWKAILILQRLAILQRIPDGNTGPTPENSRPVKTLQSIPEGSTNKVCAGTYPGMGLCNRIRALLSAMRMAQLSGIPYCLYWPISREVPCRFDELFEMPVEQVEVPYGDHPYFSWRLWVSAGDLHQNWAKAYPSDDVNGRAIDFEYERIPPQVREQYLSLISHLRPRRELLRRADAILPAPFVSVHVRDGSDWNEMGRGVPLENFVVAMDRCPPDTRYFLSAHTQETVDQLSSRFPGRITCQAGKDYAGGTAKRMQDAVVDLLCLARGTQLIGTFASTFTETAWWLGGCRQPVTIVEGDRSRFRWT